MNLREKARKAPRKYAAFIAIGLGAILGGPFVANEAGLFDRNTREILSDLQQFENCSLTYEINEKSFGKYGRYHHDTTVLTCDLSAEQRKAQNVPTALELEKNLQEEVKGITAEAKKEISDRIIAHNARVNPEDAVAQVVSNSTSHHFESCELIKKDTKNSIDCVVSPSSAKDPKMAAVIKESFDNMNIRIAQLDENSVNKLAEKIKEARSKDVTYKFAENKGNKPL